LNYKYTDSADYNRINRLEIPLIYLSFRGDTFKDIKIIMEDITEGYLLALDNISKNSFHEDFCKLDSNQLRQIRMQYPLNIRIIKM
jgi:hypothetical protein